MNFTTKNSSDGKVQHNEFLLKSIDFVHSANLNKTTTHSLLSLLRSNCSCSVDIIPKTTDALLKELDIKLAFNTFYFCSICFIELNNYQDICSQCNARTKANSELCIFSLDEEIKRVVRSNIDLVQCTCPSEGTHRVVLKKYSR